MSVLQTLHKTMLQGAIFFCCLSPLVGHSEPAKSYIDPETGQGCVRPVENNPKDPYQPSETQGYYYFVNSCSASFNITATLKNGKKSPAYIGPKTPKGPGTAHIMCTRAAGECGRISWEAE